SVRRRRCVTRRILRPSRFILFPYTTLFRSRKLAARIERYGSRHMAGRSERSTARLANRLMSPVLQMGSIEENLALRLDLAGIHRDRKSTRLNSSHQIISYAVFCLKKQSTST